VALGAIALLLSTVVSCGQKDREPAPDNVPLEVNAWARQTVDLLRSGLGAERPIPNIYLPDGRESAYDVSAAVVALVLSGQRLTAEQLAGFVQVASDSWNPRLKVWKSGAVPSSATAGMVLTALDALRDQSADQLSDSGDTARLRALAAASATDQSPRPGSEASGRALTTIEQALTRRAWITPQVAGLLRSLPRTAPPSAAGEQRVVLGQVARLMEADQITPHPVAFALVAQALHRWDVDFRLSSDARDFLEEVLLYRAMRSVAVRDGSAYADLVTSLRLLGSPIPEPGSAGYFAHVRDSSANIAVRLAYEAPVPGDLVERDATGLRGPDLNPDHVALLAKASVGEHWSCGSELGRVLRRSLSLIRGGSAVLTELSSLRVAQAWWVATAAVRCHIGPNAAQVQSRLTDLVSARMRTTLSRGGASAMERALSLSALLEVACANPATAPELDATRLVQRALAVTNPHGGAGYRTGQVDPFVTESVSRILSFADHGCGAKSRS